MDRRAHYLLRAAAIAVLVVEAVIPARTPAKTPAQEDIKVSPAPAPSVPVAMT